MKMKKMLALAMALCTTFSMSACSASATSDDAVVEIEYWHINGETFGGPVVSELIAEFNDTHEYIHVTEKYIPNSYQGVMQDFQAQAAIGSAPDLVQMGWSYKEYFSNNFAYIDAYEFAADYMGADSNFIDETYDEAIKNLAITTNGDMAGFPYGLSVPILYLNDDLLAEAGITADDLKTWPDVLAAADAITQQTGKYGFYMTEYSYTWELQQLIESNGGNYVLDGLCDINSEAAIEAYSLLADAVLNTGSALHTTSEEGKQAFMAGEVAIAMDSIASGNVMLQNATMPVSTIVAPYWEGQEWKVPCGGNFLAVTSTEEAKQQATAELVAFLLETDNMLDWDDAAGYIPPIKSAAESERMLSNPVKTMAYDCLPNAVAWAAFPGDFGLEAEQILISARDQILGGTLSVEAALENAENQINALYK